MQEPINEFDPRHPHERDGRNERPVFDKDGRCLVCCRDYRAAEIDRLTARVAELEHVKTCHKCNRPPLGCLEFTRARLDNDSLQARIAELENVLRSVACSLSVGGFNADTVDPAEYERKIGDGIDMLIRPLTDRIAELESERDKAIGCMGAVTAGGCDFSTWERDSLNQFAVDATARMLFLEAQLAGVPALVEAARKLSFAAQITGGTAGRDDHLVSAIDGITAALAPFTQEHQ